MGASIEPVDSPVTPVDVAYGLKTNDYVHLHNHTHHSLLDGLTKVNELVDNTIAMGMDAVAITDHGTMSGAIEFYKAAKGKGIKPIIGIETYVAARTLHDRDPAKDKARYHLILLAMNYKGYQNLCQLSTTANLEGFYYKPRIDHDLLEKHNEGLIALSACASGEVGEALRADNYEEAKRQASWYKSVFGDRYYLEVQDHGFPEHPHAWDVQVKINEGLLRLSEELDIQTVITSDAHYLAHADSETHEVLLCVQTGSFLSDENRMSLSDFELHVTDPRDIIQRWGKDHPESVTNARAIADRCNLELELGKILIPTFPTPEGHNEKTYLDLMVYRGLAWRYGDVAEKDAPELSLDEAKSHVPEDVIERANYELGVIDKMGFNGYFLIIWDFIKWGKDRGIIFGPGRGSAAGSLISYSLRITELDPLKYDLLFERFLNPDRISMPDVDIDIQDTRRDEVIAYCSDKYGADRVANIATFGTMAARAAVRDVARVLQVPYGEADRLAKLIPPPVQGRHIPLKKSVVDDPDLKREYEGNETTKRVLDLAIRLEGTIRSHGIHAAGVVIAPDDIVKFAPLEMAQKGVVSTQFPKDPIEELGLLKMDFLGLSNLSIINTCLRIIKKVYKNEIDLEKIPLDDEPAYKLFQRGDTTGVFQLESAGMKRYLRELKPSRFEDIIAMVALYRPGPMQFIGSFINRKHGSEEITYLHPKFEAALKDTYGILVYQEQFMQISKDFSGFTGGQADTLRKAVGKKNVDLMRKVKADFVQGAVDHSGADPKLAEKFWGQLEEFANYCFNKSHAACYGLIAYWTAYLKAHYPDAFMAALMTSDQDDIERLAIEITECKHMGITVLSPDVNGSFVEFAVVPGQNEIRFGMAAVKGVGVGAVEEILRARQEDNGGPFVSIEDFAKRVNARTCNKKAYESLIKAGAFDSLGDRSDLLFNLETIMSYASKLQKEMVSNQADLFGGFSTVSMPNMELVSAPLKHTEKERLLWERELMGLYISAHPLDRYGAYFSEQTLPINQLNQDCDGKPATVGGLISTVRTILTKSGTKMAFVGIEDKTGELEIIVFPRTYEEVGAKLVTDAAVRITGKVNARDRDGNLVTDLKIIADEIHFIDDKELDTYEATGRRMGAPKVTKKPEAVKVKRTPGANGKFGGNNYAGAKPAAAKAEAASTGPRVVANNYAGAKPIDIPEPKKLFIHVKNPADHDGLLKMKQNLNNYPGDSDIVLVLGTETKSAIKLPFKVAPSEPLLKSLAELYGEAAVVLK